MHAAARGHGITFQKAGARRLGRLRFHAARFPLGQGVSYGAAGILELFSRVIVVYHRCKARGEAIATRRQSTADMLELKLLMLIIIANGSPIVAKKLLGDRWQSPVDAGKRFIDHKPLFGAAKTWRGIVAACLLTGLAAGIVHLSCITGFLIALCAMLGDLCSSFIKRRLGMPSSSRALGLDQIPESLLPLAAIKLFAPAFSPPLLGAGLTWTQVWQIVAVFFVAELLASRMLYRLRIRNEPY